MYKKGVIGKLDNHHRHRHKRKKSHNEFMIILILLICSILALSGLCVYLYMSSKQSGKKQEENIGETSDVEILSEEESMRQQAKELVSQMSLNDKAAQMFVITPEALTGVDTAVAAGTVTEEAIQRFPVGGIVYFAKNLENPDQVKEMIANTKKYSMDRIGLLPFITVDEEGGTVTRFGGNENFEMEAIGDMRDIGITGDSGKAYEVGTKLGSFLYELGFNVDNAPVADVLSNPANTVVKTRSFGSDCNLVSEMALAELRGIEDQNVVGVLKHYPGHGATEADSHQGYAYTNATLDEMMSNELVPFINGINSGVQMIMVGHISCPNVTDDNMPASMSEKMVSDILRTQLGYEGVVTTDAMDMGAIAESYSSGDAAVRAIQAGVDIILMPDNFQEAYQGVIDAVENGTISEERIDESLLRIVYLKLQMEQME